MMVAIAGDPDVDMAGWLGGQALIGISQKLKARGILPRIDPIASDWDSLRYYLMHKGALMGMDTEEFN